MAYNGWKNWETWNVALWFNNEERFYRKVRRHEGRFTSANAEDFVLEMMPGGTPDMRELSEEELHAAWSKVSWREIASAFNEMRS